VHGRDELDERDDLAIEDFERLGGNVRCRHFGDLADDRDAGLAGTASF
jgi:hypothetical protein